MELGTKSLQNGKRRQFRRRPTASLISRSPVWRGPSAGFGYGAVNGYPGASAKHRHRRSRHIKGYLGKKLWRGPGFQSYYRISADIDSVLSQKKIPVRLQTITKPCESNGTQCKIEVEQQNLVPLYPRAACNRVDCSVRENADPKWLCYSFTVWHDWMWLPLFDGRGESSLTTFSASPYEWT